VKGGVFYNAVDCEYRVGGVHQQVVLHR
jgi:hypothetical protein